MGLPYDDGAEQVIAAGGWTDHVLKELCRRPKTHDPP